ncbi:MAG: Mitochondrial distribution and morphology protein 10 [Bathelium mastoideum]|nr:MAG: Mitochondrial distribution and morphology protein 10 [Bathelium mastoideum]
MRDFMDFVQNAFYEKLHWNNDNFYGTLTATAKALLDFDTPRGLRLNASSLSSPNFATSYSLSNAGAVDGSLSFLYSSLPLRTESRSSSIELRRVIQGYRHLQDLRKRDETWREEVWHQGKRVDRKDALLYGRLYLPRSTLEALYLRRISPTRQLKISYVSDSSLPHGGNVLALLQTDAGRYSTEYLYSTDSALFGVRGLYNFGAFPSSNPSSRSATYTSANLALSPGHGMGDGNIPFDARPPHGRFSAGAELYYGALNASGGLSTGIRFSTLPAHTGFPYTMTLTVNPLMGNLSSTYAVKAGENVALCSRFDFNVYSYESELQMGCEIWRLKRAPLGKFSQEQESTGAADKPGLAGKSNFLQPKPVGEDVTGVLKARVDQNWNVGVLWEGRMKELLFSIGAGFDLRKREQIFRAVGLEVQYSH